MLVRIDYTTLATYQSCPSKFNYRHIQSVVGREPAIALQFGAALHRGVEWLLAANAAVTDATWSEAEYLISGQPPAEDHNTVTDPVGATLHALTFELAAQNSPMLRIASDSRRSFGHLLTLLIRYHEHYGPGHGIDYTETEAQAEKFLGVTPNGIQVIYTGNIDGLTADAVIERKTTYSISAFLDKVTPNNQITGYAFLTGKERCLVDLVSTDGYGRSKNAATSYPDRWLINTDPAKLFLRTETTRSVAQIEEWKQNVLQTVDYMVNDIKSKNFAMRTDACTDFNSTCPFIDLCRTSDLDLRDSMSRSMIVEPWESFSTSD